MLRLAFYPLLVVLTVLVVSFSLDGARLNRIASEYVDIERSAELAWKSVLEGLSFSLYSGASDTRAKVNEIYAEADKRESYAGRCAVAFAAVACAFFGVSIRLRAHDTAARASIVGDLLAVSAICLIAGILAPVLSLKAFATAPMVGEVVLKFEAKSVISTIATLAQTGNYFVALLIVGFSIVTPLAKLIIACAVVQHRWPQWHQRGIEFMKALGKWSMADVFVVAILVAYFAGGGDEFSEAKIGLGFYFFTAYCLLSLYGSQALMRTVARETAATDSRRNSTT